MTEQVYHWQVVGQRGGEGALQQQRQWDVAERAGFFGSDGPGPAYPLCHVLRARGPRGNYLSEP